MSSAPFSNVTFSKYQLAVFAAVEDGTRNILVNAVAGSGKSFTLENATRRISRGKSVIALAFNKSIAEELQRRIPDGAVASTLNSVGNRAWGSFCRSRIDGSKTRTLARDVVPYNERELTADVVSLVTKAKVHGLVPTAAIETSQYKLQGLMADTDENWLNIAARYSIELPWQYARVLGLARQLLTKSILNTNVIDFDDQLYMPVIHGVRFARYDWVLVDEAQDLSDIQMEMIARMGDERTRYLMVGDRKQAIYSFRGADVKAMDRIKARFNCVELPLSVTYRCPRLVVEEARKYEPTIEAREGAPDGIVRQGGWAAEADYQVGDMVICRRAAPVVTLAYTLIGRRIPCRVQGRDLAEGIKSLVRKLKAKSVENLLEKLADWETRQVDLLRAADADDAKIEAIYDKAATLRVVIQSCGATTIEQVEREIDGLFSGDGPCVLLSTVHRAKGIEADRVFVIDHGMWFHKKKTLDAAEQETNIAYVSVTRAKKELVYVTSAPPPPASEQKAQQLI